MRGIPNWTAMRCFLKSSMDGCLNNCHQDLVVSDPFLKGLPQVPPLDSVLFSLLTWPPWPCATGHHWQSFETWSPPLHCPTGSCMETISVTSTNTTLRPLLWYQCSEVHRTCAPEDKVSVVESKADEVLASAVLSKFLQLNGFSAQRKKMCGWIPWNPWIG